MAFTEITDDIEKVDAAHGGVLALTAAEDVIAGQVVKMSGDNSVEPSDADGEEVIGVATQTVSAGDSVTVLSAGTIANVRAGAAVTVGEIAAEGATGEEGEVVDATTGDYRVGFALESISDGDYGQALILPGGQLN